MNRKRKMNKPQRPWNMANTHALGIQKKKRAKGEKKLFKDIMVANVPILIKKQSTDASSKTKNKNKEIHI